MILQDIKLRDIDVERLETLDDPNEKIVLNPDDSLRMLRYWLDTVKQYTEDEDDYYKAVVADLEGMAKIIQDNPNYEFWCFEPCEMADSGRNAYPLERGNVYA